MRKEKEYICTRVYLYLCMYMSIEKRRKQNIHPIQEQSLSSLSLTRIKNNNNKRKETVCETQIYTYSLGTN